MLMHFEKFQTIQRKPNNVWVHQGIEFYNSFFKEWLKVNDIEMYSTQNEGKSVVAERLEL